MSKRLAGEIKLLHLPQDAISLGENFFFLADQSYETGSPWKKELFIKELQHEQAYYFAFYQEENLLGFAGCHKVLDEIEIMSVAVAPAFKGLKIGEQLLRRMLHEAKTWQCSQLFLEVRASNQAALKLYQKMDFKQIGLRKKYYHNPQEDGIVMSLQLVDKK